MNKLKTIVVEDERLPRLSLLAKLEDFRHTVEVVDACDNYESARMSILRHRPDLLFLDIQLQGRDSIGLLDELKETIPLPYIIFTTAYSDSRYLMSAIKLSAVDYLMKPIDKGELAHAIAKATDRAEVEATAVTALPEKLSLKSVNGKVFIATDDIAYIKADGNYSLITTFHSQNLILESLLTLEQKLPSEKFVRVDRSTIVNLTKVFRLNHKQLTCVLLSAQGRELRLELTKIGMEKLMEVVE
ncbi:MAG: response regulator transcription factor [Bacteroidaceae bacterium]|nr:response regulator transcription factor [Bacteroidaceae bacterium]MBQ9176201.1 response regulator transcription factor [Bacteroidaceae bacterium]MBR1378176.1 response regulator transcription factor [Bacteroidaceae bacterium]